MTIEFKPNLKIYLKYHMASLTQIAVTTRKSFRWGLYGFISIILVRAALLSTISVYKRLNPPPPPPPTVGFNLLPTINFPEVTSELPPLEYKIETPTGTFPEFPETMPVYLMPKASISISSADSAITKAQAFGFGSIPLKLSDTLYKFLHPTIPSSMEINIVTETFSTSYNLAADPTPIKTTLPTPDVATSKAKSFLSKGNSLPEDVEDGTVTHEFLKVEGQNLVSAISLSEADLIKVNLFREPINLGDEKNPLNYLSLPPNPDTANIWAIVSGSQDVIASQYHYYPIEKSKIETYPIKTAQQAYDALIAGKGYISNLGLNRDGKVTIREITLAYFDPNIQSQFYQPIFVFRGDRDFWAYVPAVTSEYYEE